MSKLKPTPTLIKKIYKESELFGKMLFVTRYDFLGGGYTVFLADSRGNYHYSDETTLEPDAYIHKEESIVYDDLANQEWERTKRDFEEVFGSL